MSDGVYSELEPGVVTDGAGTIYYRNEEDRLHREDGPAFTASNGYHEYWLEGISYTEETFNYPAKIKEYKKN